MQDQSDQSDQPKRRRRKAARPAEIIAAAMTLWAERGFAATRLEDVAAGAGVAKGTIYLYFPSKEALFEAAVQDRLIGVIDHAGLSPAAMTGSTEQMLHRLLSAIYTQALDAGLVVLLKVLISEGHRFPQLVTFYQEAAISRIMALVAAVLERGAARGEIRRGMDATDPRLVIAPAMVSGLWGLVFSPETPAARDRYMAAHLDLLLHGLLRPAPPPPAT